MDSKLLALVLIFSSVLLTSTYVSAAPFTQKDNEAKEEIFSSTGKLVNNSYSQYKTIIGILHTNNSVVIYNQSEAPPIVIPPPVNNTGNQTGGNGTTGNGTTTPPTCPTGQHYNTTTTQCEDDVIVIPPPPPVDTSKPVVDVNATKFLRVATIGDIDDNSGLTTQLNLVKKYHTKILIIVGDYGYKSCPAVIDKIHAAGFDSKNAVIVQGNHDCSSNTKAFNGGWSTLYGNTNFPNVDGKLSVFAIDGNSNFDCTSTQFKTMKSKLESSDAWYNIPAIHQPFVTVKSDHGPNGQFNCWNPLFSDNNVDLVLEAHNHNYQRIPVNGIDYLLVGTGTHDTGSKMYPLNSNSWNGFACAKCITGTNGITLMDFQIDNPNVRHMNAWFISNADTVKDTFN